MKKSELKQLIREEIQKSLIKENTGLITFEQLKQACVDSYKEFLNTDDVEEVEYEIKELIETKDIYELLNALDGFGFNGNEAYDFIFDSILKN